MEELKPCPFCGKEKITIEERWQYFGYCVNCGCEGPNAPTKRQAISAWNKRSK